MGIWIGLLRGINVGGNNIIKMADLKQALSKDGLENLDTYIQSGNLVFQSSLRSRASVQKRIADRIRESFGHDIPVIARDSDSFCSAMDANPFPDACADPKSLHVGFLGAIPKRPDLRKLAQVKTSREDFNLIGDTFYFHAPDGVGRSKLAAQVENCLGVPMTSRNWRTISKLHQMAVNQG